jgi:hypothetical protein
MAIRIYGPRKIFMTIERTLNIIVTITLIVMMVATDLRARWANTPQRCANLVSKILNLVAAVFILPAHFRMLTHNRLNGFAGLPTLLISTLTIGWILGGSDNRGRRSLAPVRSL